jgi:hypothetical protein
MEPTMSLTMDRHQFTAEDREERLTTETRAQFSTISRAILAGDEPATKRITDALGEYIADDSAAAELVRAVLLNSQAALTVLVDLIWAEAAALAEVEVAKKELCRAESQDENRIAQAEVARALH